MTTTADSGSWVDIRILQLPVAIWARTQQHTDELLREFTLIAEQMSHEADAALPLPVRLVNMVEELTSSYGAFSEEQEARMFQAVADGEESIDLVYRLPTEVGPGARHLGDLLNDADEYCKAGQHLLTLTTPSELVRFREWFLEEFRRQADGMRPTPWPEHAR